MKDLGCVSGEARKTIVMHIVENSLMAQMKAIVLLTTMVETKILKKFKIYGFWPENVKISGFWSFPVSAHSSPSVFIRSKRSLFKKTTIEIIKKVGTPGQHSEIDEIVILPYTKCMGAIFRRKFLSS